MTADELAKMTDREINRLAVEKVLGWTLNREQSPARWNVPLDQDGYFRLFDGFTDVPKFVNSPAYSADLEAHVCTLADYNGEIVPHRVTDSQGTVRRGTCLRERYVLTLLRIAANVTDYEITTMGENNRVLRHFTTNELFALATATPRQRTIAAILAATAKGGG